MVAGGETGKLDRLANIYAKAPSAAPEVTRWKHCVALWPLFWQTHDFDQ